MKTELNALEQGLQDLLLKANRDVQIRKDVLDCLDLKSTIYHEHGLFEEKRKVDLIVESTEDIVKEYTNLVGELNELLGNWLS